MLGGLGLNTSDESVSTLNHSSNGIQPDQAILDTFDTIIEGGLSSFISTLDLTHKGITSMTHDTALALRTLITLPRQLGASLFAPDTLILTNNALTVGGVDNILQAFIDFQIGNIDLNMSNGGATVDQAPTNGMASDLAWQYIALATTTSSPVSFEFDIHNATVSMNGTTLDGSSNAFSQAEVDAILAEAVFASSNYAQPPASLNLSGGTSAAPSGAGLANAATLTGLGWAVLTN